MRHRLPVIAVVTLALVAAVAAVRAPARVDDHPSTSTEQLAYTAAYYRDRALTAERRVRRLRREVLRRWDYPKLIAIAATVYQVDRRTLERKARCESGNFTDFVNETSGARDVFQFLPSTWQTTPFARYSINNPFAAVLAGAWMHRQGRGGEWDCQ